MTRVLPDHPRTILNANLMLLKKNAAGDSSADDQGYGKF
jgi:hypothetical protein